MSVSIVVKRYGWQWRKLCVRVKSNIIGLGPFERKMGFMKFDISGQKNFSGI